MKTRKPLVVLVVSVVLSLMLATLRMQAHRQPVAGSAMHGVQHQKPLHKPRDIGRRM